MTVDERLQFLLQSTESLHSNVQELSASVAELRGGLVELRGGLVELRNSVADLTKVVEIDADNIRRLANIAAAQNDGIEDLRTRLQRLERKGTENS